MPDELKKIVCEHDLFKLYSSGLPTEIKFYFDETFYHFLTIIEHNILPSGMPDDHILLFDEHKFNLTTIYF